MLVVLFLLASPFIIIFGVICQAGLDNKTGGTQRRLGAACFCTSKGCESPVFCAEKQG